MIKDAVLFSFDTLDVDTTTKLVLHYSTSAKENGKRIMVLDVKKFCSKILGTEDPQKLEELQILASRSEDNFENYCEDLDNYLLETIFWNNLYFFRWNRIKNDIRKFHHANARTIFLALLSYFGCTTHFVLRWTLAKSVHVSTVLKLIRGLQRAVSLGFVRCRPSNTRNRPVRENHSGKTSHRRPALFG